MIVIRGKMRLGTTITIFSTRYVENVRLPSIIRLGRGGIHVDLLSVLVINHLLADIDVIVCIEKLVAIIDGNQSTVGNLCFVQIMNFEL